MGLVVVLLILGVVLLICEVFLPGMIAGIIGFGCLVGAVVVGYLEFGPVGGNILLLGVTLGLVVGLLLWMRYLPRSPVAKLFVSERVIGDIEAERPDLVGKRGKALTTLRPSGMASLGGERVDVVSEGGLIERGTGVKVVAVEGMRVVVRALRPEEEGAETKPEGN